MSEPKRTLESYFADLEGESFGLGYGSGEEHTLAALKTFFATVGKDESEHRKHCYDYWWGLNTGIDSKKADALWKALETYKLMRDRRVRVNGIDNGQENER